MKDFPYPTRLVAAITLLAWSASAAASITDDLIGHWKLDETDSESLQVFNSAPVADPEHGVRTETIKLNQLAPAGAGYLFNGVNNNDFVALGTSYPGQLVEVREMSVSGWIRPQFLREGEGANSRQIFFGADISLQFGLEEEGLFRYVFYDEGFVGVLFDQASRVSAGEFVHVVLTHGFDSQFNDMPIRLYINGELVEEKFLFPAIESFTFQAEDPSLHLGRYAGFANTQRDFDGVLSDFGLWAGRELTHEEVAVIGGMGRAGMRLGSSEVNDVLAIYQAQSGTVTTGDWVWSYTNSFAAPADGSDLGLGKHYYGQDESIYVILGGSSNNWTGVAAEGGEPFAIPIRITSEPDDVTVNLGEPAPFSFEVEAPEAVSYQWFQRSRRNAPAEELVGETASTLSLASVEAADDGFYFCVATEAGEGLTATSREARLFVEDKPTQLWEHWLLNETAEDLEVLDPAHEPEEERETEAPLANEVPFGSEAVFVKGGSVEDPAPVFGGPSGSPLSTGSIGSDADSDSAHINMGQVAPGVEPFTIALWFKRDGAAPEPTGQQHIISSNVFPQDGRWNLHVMPGGNELRFFHNSPDQWGTEGNVGANAFDLTTSFENDRWYHVAVTRNLDDTFRLYLDGQEVFSTTNSGSLTNSVNGVWLGGRPENSEFFPGLLDDVRFYTNALSAEEIEDLIGEVPFQISIISQPEDQDVNLGETASFSVEVEADGPVDYQWFFRPLTDVPGEPIDGENAALLSVADVALQDEGYYFCRVTQSGGTASAQTRNARLTILDKPTELVFHWPLNENEEELATLNPEHEPEEERANTAPLAAAVGHEAIFHKGFLEAPGPQFGTPSPGAAAGGSTGALGPDNDLARIELGDVSPGRTFTIAFWFNRDGADERTGQQHILSSTDLQAGRWNLNMDGGDGRLRFFHNNAAEDWGLQSGGTLANAFDLTDSVQSDRWYHFAATRDADDLFRIYLDGVMVFEGTNSGDFTDAANGVWLGRRPNFENLNFRGLFDDVRFYNGALSAEEINELTGDGPTKISFEDWAAGFGLDPETDGAPEADANGDGMRNLVKYAMGLNPLEFSVMPQVDVTDGFLELAYTRSLTAEATITATHSQDPGGVWVTDGVVDTVVMTDANIEHRLARVPADTARGFLRLEVKPAE